MSSVAFEEQFLQHPEYGNLYKMFQDLSNYDKTLLPKLQELQKSLNETRSVDGFCDLNRVIPQS